VKWLGITAGEIVSEIKGSWIGTAAGIQDRGHGADQGALFQALPVEDRYVSYLDVEKMYTLRHEVHRREGRYRKDAVTDFDQVAHKAHFRSLTDGSGRSLIFPQGFRYVTSSYVARTLDLKVGESYPSGPEQ